MLWHIKMVVFIIITIFYIFFIPTSIKPVGVNIKEKCLLLLLLLL